MRARLAVIVAISLFACDELFAQNSTAVRSELAAVLLQSKKYDDAAREYRALLARDANNFAYRLGLARALAWGNRPREAERELRTLRPRTAAVDSLLESVRAALEPRASEAGQWVSERRSYAPYRLAYARALASEGYYWASSVQYDSLLMGGWIGAVPDPAELRREQASALLAAGDVVGGAMRLRDALRQVPNDTALRHELAAILASAKQYGDARAQYDTLVARAPTATLLIERAQLRLIVGDRAGAESDLCSSVDLEPTTSAYLLLGQLSRDRLDYPTARAMYRGAIAALPPVWNEQRASRANIRTVIAELWRLERPIPAFVPAVGDDAGWRATTEGVSDNLGVRYTQSTLRGAVSLGHGTRAGFSATHQYLGERSASRTMDLNAHGGEGSLATEFASGPMLVRVGLTGGAMLPPNESAITVGSATGAVWFDAWELAFKGSTGPAYPSLLTTAALRPFVNDEEILTERNLDVAVGGPVGQLDIALTAQRTELSDDNRRTTFQGFARAPIAPAVWLIYAGSRIRFTERSLRYWDPIDYVAHSVGLEIGDRPMRGFSWTARLAPGMSWSRMIPHPTAEDSLRGEIPTEVVHRTAFQIATGGEVAWRSRHVETSVAASYGLGRVGDYRRLGVTLGVRVIP